jgi:5'-nucleotidase
LLEKQMPADVLLLKVDVPAGATPQTPWQITRLSRGRYYEPIRPKRDSWDVPGSVGYRLGENLMDEPEGTDVHALRIARRVSVTPLSLDLTSRVDFNLLDGLLRE